MRTRSSAPSEQPQSPSASDHQTAATSTSAPPAQSTPQKTFILPSTASADARFLTLPNPRSAEPTRYFFDPKLGVYEFTVLSSPPTAPRSTLLVRNATSSPSSNKSQPPAHISKKAELLIATPIDILFFLIPILTANTKQNNLFQPLDDIIDSLDEELLPPHLRHVLYDETFRETLHARAAAISDSVEAGDEKLFRFNETKLLQELVAKADRMVSVGLPPSLEERFVRQALATPLMAVKRDDVVATTTTGKGENKENEGEEGEKEEEKTTTTDNEEAKEHLPEGLKAPDGVANLLRISVALTFMKECYLSKAMSARIDELLAAPESPKDFKPMRDHLELVAKLRAEALAARSVGDFSRKRSVEDQEAAESRAEKKRRMEEEEKKKKAGESRGVRDLKKVNTVGMKKMSDFFGKAAAKKKT
ncbi:hypothetical protein ASPBRDRAFT_126188 [Aspergillus brasiliensis CBS 101740]|uniref:Ribonuclease H2 subunit B n=1 Tax=Aspergillus brasiliensis (strain CBS 101740 / IMI 381727 / IBT 21946) TaxID=767769 RepID=A0A1L9UJS3_ASPBC|nr:hypothetical protein ASPBRDRAFT_126188 [Aspergillus brasiliensis CBS 101740]